MYGYISLVLFLVPVCALGWRVVVSKSRRQSLRIGGAAAAMATLVGAFTIAPVAEDFNYHDWRLDIGLLAAMAGSIYLLIWSSRKRTNHRHRTISIIAAVVGLVPVVGVVATAMVLRASQ